MQKQKRHLILVLLTVFVLMMIPQPAMANSPPPVPFCVVELANLPEDACYVDLLVPLTQSDKEFCNTALLPEGFTEDSPIVCYDEAGYMSYSFHYQDASSQLKIQDSGVTFFEENYDHGRFFKEGIQLKLVVLDSAGNILQISDSFALNDIGLLSRETGNIYYDGATQKVEIGQITSGIAIFLFMTVGAIVVSVACETIVGLCFRLKKIKTIILVNLVSQILMRIVFYLLYGTVFSSYFLLILCLELLVYTAEYMVYSAIELDLSQTRIRKFTVVANTVSLIVGILLFNPLFW